MAVRLDLDALRDTVDPAAYQEAEALLDAGHLGEIAPSGGGAVSTVENGAEVWAGIVDGVFTVECDCPGHEPARASVDPEEFCVSALALVIGAVREDFVWSPDAARPLPALTDAELAELRRIVDSLVDEAAGSGGPGPVLDAGLRIVEALDVLAGRPASEGTLELVERAARRWDELAAGLTDAEPTGEVTPEEIGDELRAIHIQVCEELQLDSDELARRLVEVIAQAKVTSCLDAPNEYLGLISPDGVQTLQRR